MPLFAFLFFKLITDFRYYYGPKDEKLNEQIITSHPT